MRKYMLIIGLIGFSSLCRAQENGNGFLGKKNLVSFFGTSSVRLLALVNDFNNLGTRVIDYNGNNTRDYRNRFFRYDIRASYARLLGSKVYLGAELSYEKIRISKEAYGTNDWSTPVVNGYGTLLTLTFNSEDGLAPLGFASTIGIGPRFYKFDHEQNYRYDSQTVMKIAYPDYATNMIGVNAFFQMSMRKLLTRFMVLEFGIRFQTGYVFKNGNTLENGKIYIDPQTHDPVYTEGYDGYGLPADATPVWSKDNLVKSLRHENMFNLASFRLGLGFMF